MAKLALTAMCWISVFAKPEANQVALEISADSISPIGTQLLQIEAKPKASAAWKAQLKSPAARKSCTPSKKQGKVVLVTGTGGFVGYHAALQLRKRGDGVLGLDNFNAYYPTNLKRAREASLMKAGVLTLEADINDEDALRRAFDLCNFTHVLHLAAQAGVRYAIKDPDSYVHSNVAGFVKVLEVAKTREPKPRVVYASSSSVYGLNTKVPFSEEDAVNMPASLYAATKREDELLAHTYNHIYGLALTGLRFFTVYGPFGRPDMAVFGFANHIMKNETVEIFRAPDGSELERDFTFIDDIVGGCLGAVDNIGPSVKPAPLRVYNLGNEHPENVTYIVDLLDEFLGEKTGKKAKRKYKPLPDTGDVLRTNADTKKAFEDIGYSANTSLREGVRKFVDWYAEYYKNGLDDDMLAYQPM